MNPNTGWKVRELVALVKEAGGVLDRCRGDHHVYRLPDGTHLSIPVGGTRNECSPKLVQVVRKKLASLRSVGATK